MRERGGSQRGGQGPRKRGTGTRERETGTQRRGARPAWEPSQPPASHVEQTWKISKPAMSRMPRKEAPCRGLRSRARLRRSTSQRKRRS